MDSFSNKTIKIKTKTWERDSYGLFDYENAQMVANSATVRKTGQLVRCVNDIQFYPNDNKEEARKWYPIANLYEQNGDIFTSEDTT